MQLVRFTKFWEDLSVRQLGERARELGYDGLDLAVRDGHALNIDNVTDELPGAVRAWRELGVDCSMISSSTDLIDPDAADAVTLFEAAAAAGVPRIKMGYFKFTPGDSFEELWSMARRRLDGFERLSRRTGVQTLYHTHSGQCLGSNCAGMRHLLQDYDPVRHGWRLRGPWPPGHQWRGRPDWPGDAARPPLGHRRQGRAPLPRRATRTDGRVSPMASCYSDKAPPSGPKRSRCSKPGVSAVPITVHTEYTTDQEVIGTVGAGEYTPEAIALRARGEVEDLAYLRGLLN